MLWWLLVDLGCLLLRFDVWFCLMLLVFYICLWVLVVFAVVLFDLIFFWRVDNSVGYI